MSRQMYKIKQEIADLERVALEVEWVGTLAVPFGSIPAGGIFRQRNYDLFRGLLEKRTRKWGRYEGTVSELIFVVPFRHCLGSCK